MEAKSIKKMDWAQFIGRFINVTMNENYGVVYSESNQENPMFFEIVFKNGNLVDYFDDGLLLESERENQMIKIFIPFSSIKCVEIF